MSKDFKPYVSIDSKMKEFSFKAIFLGVIMAVILGAANVYLGLKAGMTVAATFPAAVMAMAVLRIWPGQPVRSVKHWPQVQFSLSPLSLCPAFGINTGMEQLPS